MCLKRAGVPRGGQTPLILARKLAWRSQRLSDLAAFWQTRECKGPRMDEAEALTAPPCTPAR